MPQSAATDKYQDTLVQTIPFESPVPFRRVALAYRKSAVKKDAVKHIVNVIKSLEAPKIFNN